MSDMITIDGSQGEGGGQILRTALGLSLVTGRPFRLEQVRARRSKPGLLRQHLTAVQAAAAVSGGRVDGAELGSRTLTFEPRQARGGEYHFAVGTAGSATLVLQTILPALMTAAEPSQVLLEGGTHNPYAPPFDFLSKTFLPVLRRLGPSVDVSLDRHGFYPAGGGRFAVRVAPSARLERVSLLERGALRVSARAITACLPGRIADRELAIVRERLGLERAVCRAESADCSIGPGNVLMIVLESDALTEVVTAFGEKGVSAEAVADSACAEARAYMACPVPVGQHLADQLLVPMAMAGGGSFRTLAPTSHTRTNAEVVSRFLDVDVAIDAEPDGAYRVEVKSRTSGERR
jgi:RNA 3'-terminal phosphate cyclase (ATP)